MRSIFAPHLGRHVKVGGRKRAVSSQPRMPLAKYLHPTAPPDPPEAIDYAPKANDALRKIYKNDELGCCTVAGAYHVLGTVTGNATLSPFIASDDQIVKDYETVGGYVPGDPSTDNGANEETVLNFYTNTGFADGSKLAGFLAVDPTNIKEIQQACFLFENLYLGIDLPNSWIDPFPSGDGFVWDTDVPNPKNGHCVMSPGYDSSGILVGTWGLIGSMTWVAVESLCSKRYGGALYTLLSPEIIANGQVKAPNGFDWQELITDFRHLRS